MQGGEGQRGGDVHPAVLEAGDAVVLDGVQVRGAGPPQDG